MASVLEVLPHDRHKASVLEVLPHDEHVVTDMWLVFSEACHGSFAELNLHIYGEDSMPETKHCSYFVVSLR